MQTQAKTTEKIEPTKFSARDLTFEGMKPRQTRVQKYKLLKKQKNTNGRTHAKTVAQEKELANYSTREERKEYQKKYGRTNGIMNLLPSSLPQFGKGTFRMMVTTVTDSSIAVFNTMKSKSYTFKGKHSISRKK
ncbi:hypothetical protein bcgnr5390_16090 [Bacillus luti]|nr:hypothetical protein BC2903_53350 [Bacillus cereus]